MAQPAPKHQPAPTVIWSPKKAVIAAEGTVSGANDNLQRKNILEKRRRRHSRIAGRA